MYNTNIYSWDWFIYKPSLRSLCLLLLNARKTHKFMQIMQMIRSNMTEETNLERIFSLSSHIVLKKHPASGPQWKSHLLSVTQCHHSCLPTCSFAKRFTHIHTLLKCNGKIVSYSCFEFDSHNIVSTEQYGSVWYSTQLFVLSVKSCGWFQNLYCLTWAPTHWYGAKRAELHTLQSLDCEQAKSWFEASS